MCCNKCGQGPGFIGRQIIYSQGKREAARHEQELADQALQRLLQGAAKPRLTATDKANRFLAVVGVMVLVTYANVILHVLAIALASVLAVLAAGAGFVAVRRARQRRQVAAIEAPRPARAIEGRRRDVAALSRDHASTHVVTGRVVDRRWS